MILATLVGAGLAFVRLTSVDHGGFTLCTFKALTGYACFTCGSTRAFGHLSHFDVPSALAVQPLVTCATLLVLAWGLADAVLMLGGRRLRVSLGARSRRIGFTLAVLVAILNWIYLLATGV